MVRLNGAAVGAVDVLGGAENVRPPREPELPPPPTRASAAEMASIKGNANDKTTAIAWTMPRVRCVNFMSVSLSPRQGEARLRWAPPLKSESHYQKQRLRPSVAGMRQLSWLFGRRALDRQSEAVWRQHHALSKERDLGTADSLFRQNRFPIC
jgi:hypothetical protein